MQLKNKIFALAFLVFMFCLSCPPNCSGKNEGLRASVKIKGMEICDLYTEGKVSTLITTGGLFRIDLEKGLIEIEQRIGENRLLAKVILEDKKFKRLSAPILMGFDCIWEDREDNLSESPKIIISGDSVIRFYNIKKIKVVLHFTPVHQKFNVSITQYNNGGLLALDEKGGLCIAPPSYASNKRWPKEFKNNVWRLAAERPLPLLFIGVLPPRLFDWERSFYPIIHYSSHAQRYPTDEQIAVYSKYAKVLEMHSWVWQNRHNTADDKDNPLWADSSYQPQNHKWIPDQEHEFIRVIDTAHRYGMKILPYVSTEYDKKLDLETFIAEMKRLKDTYNVDGVYMDGLFYQRPELSYKAARILRELFGEDGWLTLHDTHGSGYWTPFVNSYMDLVVTSEHNSLERWTSTSYKISNAIASVWPEIPFNIKAGREYLRKLVDESLSYNNRLLIMTGKGGQWRNYRLYFTPDEMEFMTTYYLGTLEKIKSNLSKPGFGVSRQILEGYPGK